MKLFKDHFLQKLNNDIKEYKDRRFKDSLGPVLGYGNPEAEVMFIGDMPGKKECQTGIPFTGKSKENMIKILGNSGLKKGDYYLTYLAKYLKPGTVYFHMYESRECFRFLNQEIDIIQPKIICTLGYHSSKYILEHYEKETNLSSLKEIHGNALIIPEKIRHKKLVRPRMYVIPTWSPSLVDKVVIIEDVLADVMTIKSIMQMKLLLF